MTLHTYSSHLVWEGSTLDGYHSYSRAHRIVAPPAATGLTLSADPRYRGDPTLLNPEQLLVMAASSCQLLSFLALAARHKLDIRSYADQARGYMTGDGRESRIGRIELSPTVRLGADGNAQQVQHVERLLHEAHRGCYIANSLSAEVTVTPTVVDAWPARFIPRAQPAGHLAATLIEVGPGMGGRSGPGGVDRDDRDLGTASGR
jgi:organic hydroperoxide reductase OsmC/OhrA